MSNKSDWHNRMRVYHRYLGFFLVGIMAVYATSGVILIFRSTDVFKKTNHEVHQLKPNLTEKEVGEEMHIRDLKFESQEGAIQKFKQGTYNAETGTVEFTEKKYPLFIEKLTDLHKTNTKDPLFFLNIFFGVSLLFFVISSFWMFMPNTSVFKKGTYFTLAGIALTLLMLLL